MRVIAGKAKGRRLKSPGLGTRPMTDRMKEAVFSSLGDLKGLVVLDLYAGSGSLGLEALSRGAASCLFVDASRGAVRAIQANMTKTKLGDRVRILHQDALWALQREDRGYDLIFLDPPYATEERELRPVLARAAELAAGGTIVLTRPKRAASIDVIPIDWAVARLLRYGDARILVCREER